jgi:hypothetical protein
MTGNHFSLIGSTHIIVAHSADISDMVMAIVKAYIVTSCVIDITSSHQ